MTAQPPTQRPTRDSDTQPIPRVVTGERKRAALALLVLAVLAAVVVVIMVKVLGGGSNGNQTAGPSSIATSGPPVTVTHPSRTTTSRSTSPSTSPSSSSRSTGPSNRRVSCPTAAPCALPDDIGDALGALNRYREQHGAGTVRSRITTAAKQCAASLASDCQTTGHWFWEPVGRSGKQMVDKILARGATGSVLAASLRSVQIGWAYIPSSKSFSCVIIFP